MKPFQKDAICVKCGGREILAVWCKSPPIGLSDPCCPRDGSEHMHRSCKFCRFQWIEAPLDMPLAKAPVAQARVSP